MKKIIGKLKKLVFGHVSILIVLLCIVPLFFVGGGLFRGVEIEQAPMEQEDLIVVGVSQLGSESGWRSAHTLSIQDALTKDAGYFLILNNARQMQENQIKAIRGFISQRVDYIVFAPVIESGWETVLREAKDAEIPVIIIDRMVDVRDESLYTTWIGTDTKEEGKKAGRWLERYLRKMGRASEEINIVVLQGTLGSTAELGRTKGFCEIAEYHDNWHILEQRTGDFTATRGKEVMWDMLRRHEDIDILVSQNDDMTMGAIEAMQEAGISFGEYGAVTVISFDAIYDALELVKKGWINVDIECNPVQGAYIDKIIQRLERGEPVEKSYVVEENVFTKENVEKFMDDRTY
ncbi:ABC transporter substrate-binding protein [Parablautia muri]|uniref:LacI family transcriptional regulator n=1 Tax=Parablautia muri TaxID=2320879 RepID=A0A9X5GS39_9FIRM|nr:ABC transporter substrate-binding protein [Parablautia muri]NBJ91707.1 LacI family transcriptional regulator [Parablautia muri]